MSQTSSLRKLPWVIALVALVVYAVTLNRWVSLLNLAYVARISGWLWQPETYSPASFLATYPFRWLPGAWIPVALNIFSALCAAGTLGLLARSVALLPQDRTGEQRLRIGKSRFALFAGSGDWLPPVLAAMVCGLQLTFWEQATNCAGEMFDLLLFAFVIWSLLEYRIDRRGWRMAAAALVYGAGMAENWAMVGFLPVFLWTVFHVQDSDTPGGWWRKFGSESNARIFALVGICGLLGGMLYLLRPLIGAVEEGPLTFWQALKANLVMQESSLKQFATHRPMAVALGRLMLGTLLPVFVMTRRWNPGVPEQKTPAPPTVLGFHLISAALLLFCVWNAFDPPVSPRRLGFGYPWLTFYYLNSLAAGYYAGYFLVVSRRRDLRPRKKPFWQRLTLNGVAFGATCLLLALTGGLLVYKNAPQILATNDETMARYAALMERELPREGGVLASSDSRCLFLAQAVLARDGRTGNFVPLDLASFQRPDYHRFLRARFPDRWPETVDVNEEDLIDPARLTVLLAAIAQTNVVYGLQPEAGRYGDRVWLEPHGLVYKVNALGADALFPPAADAEEIKRNETFWQGALGWAVASVAEAIPPTGPAESHAGRMLAGLRAAHEENPNATTAAAFYARALDFWGVRLQRAGELDRAAPHFQMALRLNPANLVAQINLQFNDTLRAGREVTMDVSPKMEDQFGGGRTWAQITEAYGPIDEPSFCFMQAHALAKMNLSGPAADLFSRVSQLAPGFFPARVWLAGLYVGAGLPDRAVEPLRDMHARPEQGWLAAAEQARFSCGEADAYFARRELTHSAEVLERALTQNPANDDLLGAAVELYIYRGLMTNALALVDNRLRLTPDDPGWTFARGYISLRQTNYNAAIAAFSTVLAGRKDHADARLNRAVAYLESNQLDAARRDFQTIAQAYPASAQAALGLGEIAWCKKETNEAARYYELFLANTTADSTLAASVRQRLKTLKARGN